MEIISVNVGLPKQVHWKNRTVKTSIFKFPVSGRKKVNYLNISGDKQADLKVHGGPDKAVYAYASEHYSYWREIYPDKEFNWGMFGENLTVRGGLFEDEIYIGDRFRIGTAELMAVQPRIPCYKLGIRFGTEAVIKKFLQSGLCGVYFRVIKEGEIESGSKMEKIKNSPEKISIADVNQVFSGRIEYSRLEKIARHPDLAENLKNYFLEKLNSFGR